AGRGDPQGNPKARQHPRIPDPHINQRGTHKASSPDNKYKIGSNNANKYTKEPRADTLSELDSAHLEAAAKKEEVGG
ncbi:Hypothetical predicted protein, partial [Pelobates cultripes]